MQIQFFAFFQVWGTSVGSDFVVLGPANPLRHTFKVSRTKRNVQQKKEFVHHGREMRWICAEKRERQGQREVGGGQVKILLLHHQFLDFWGRSWRILTCSWSSVISLVHWILLAPEALWSAYSFHWFLLAPEALLISFLIPFFAPEDLCSASLHWLLLACSSRPLIGFIHSILGRSWSSLISNISSQITKNAPETLCNHKTLITVSSFRIDNKQSFMISRSFDNGSRSLETIDQDLQQR